MTQTWMYVLFGAGAVAVTASVHYYLYRRLVKSTELPPPYRRIATVALIVLAAGMPLSMGLSLVLPTGVARILLYPFLFWIGPMVLLTTLFALTDLVRLTIKGSALLVRRPIRVDPGRRLFLIRTAAGVTTATVFTAAAAGTYHALKKLVVRNVAIPLDRLPAALDGFTIAQISDLHLGVTRSGAWLAEVVRRVNALGADLVAVTGDLVDGRVAQLRDEVAPIGKLKAPHGVFFVTGNHEYYSGAVEWVAELRRLGLRVLRNEHVPVGRNSAFFDLAGVDDYRAEGLAPGHKHDVPRAVKGHDPSRELVLLAHQPLSIFDAARYGVGLVLCGHTHGGQLWPVTAFSHLVNHYVRGLHKHGPTWIYVNSGTGFWGPPIRIFSTAEITRVALKATPSRT